MRTIARDDTARGPARILRLSLLAVITFDLGMVAARAVTYPSFLAWPGAPGYIIEAVAALAIYAALVAALPFVAARMKHAAVILRVGVVVGLIAGGLEIANITLESLFALSQQVVTIATGAAMLALFLLFGVAGFSGCRSARSFWPGVAAAVWSAVIAILIAVTFGFLLMNVALPQLARDMRADPDYLRSGWTDTRAFAIANTLDAGFSHLVEAPVIAAALGSLGSGLGMVVAQRRTVSPA